MAKISDRLDALVCDMDGVLYRGDVAVDGAAAALDRLREAGVRIMFCTNNSRSSVERYVEKLKGLGFAAEREDVITSAVVTGDELARRHPDGGSVYVVGGPGIRDILEEQGFRVAELDEAASVTCVVVGWDKEFTWDKMRVAASAVRRGASLIATNDDATFPSADGLWPGAGSILASIEKASGERAEVMGKPHRPMLNALANRLSGIDRIGMIGDRDDTDLEGARRMGWMTILALSGVTSEADAVGLDPRPDLVVPSLAVLS